MSDRIDGGARAFVCGRSGGSARLVRFLGNTSVVLTWAGTGRVDIFSAAAGLLRHIVTL